MKRAKSALKRVEKLLAKLDADVKKYKAVIVKLTRQGATAGTIVWQEKRPGYKVAYLNHATNGSDGKRVREYIGKDGLKIKEATARIKRAEKIRVLEIDLRRAEEAIDRMALLLNSTINQCSNTSNGQRCMW